MDEEKTRTYTIEVERTVREVLDLLTRKREYALLGTRARLPRTTERDLERSGYEWLGICDASKAAEPNMSERSYLIIGGELDSRDHMQIDDFQEMSMSASIRKDCRVSFPAIDGLYSLCEGKSLKYRITASSEAEANEFWLRGMLPLGNDFGKYYMSNDFSSVTVRLQRISEEVGSREVGERPSEEPPASVDIAEFEVYDHLSGWLEREARSYCYGDDIFVEYSISSDEGVARYCATEFYSNHRWNLDPANLLVVRFLGEIVPKSYPQEKVRYSHPTKATTHKEDGRRFLVDSLVTTNDVAVKWYHGIGDEQRPDEGVSADRIMDNPIDFNRWVFEHRVEIEMA